MTTEAGAVTRPTGSSVEEDLQVVAGAIEQLIQNVKTQSQINDAIVGRLLALERRVAELAEKRQEGRVEKSACDRSANEEAQERGEGNPGQAAALPGQRHDGLPMYLGECTAMCRVMMSFLMYVDTRDTYITPPLLLSGIWEPIETRFVMRTVKGGMRVVDVGANCGYYTILMAAAAGPNGHLYAFEPDVRNLELIDRNLQVNGFLERVTVIPRAALDKKKAVELHQNARNRGAHTLFVADPALALHPRTRVEAVPLDEAVEGTVDFVKIDAEGSEPFVIRGMKKLVERSPGVQVLMEFNRDALRNAGVRPEDFLLELKNDGWKINRLSPQSSILPVNEAQLPGEAIASLVLSRARA